LYNIDDFDVQFDIVAHSKGGLIARYFLRYGDQILPNDYSQPKLTWEGRKDVDKVILVATPNGGYMDAFIELVNGLKVVSMGPVLPASVVGTFPSYYQMIPSVINECITYCGNPRHSLDVFDYKTWLRFKWGLANPNQFQYIDEVLPDVLSLTKKREVAIDHLDKCLKRAKQFHESINILDYTAENQTTAYLFLGNAVETSRCADINENGEIKITQYEVGDGKVLASSALMDEREISGWEPFLVSPVKWQAVIHIEAAHIGITESPNFADNLIYYLINAPSKKFEKRKDYLKKLIQTIK